MKVFGTQQIGFKFIHHIIEQLWTMMRRFLELVRRLSMDQEPRISLTTDKTKVSLLEINYASPVGELHVFPVMILTR